MNYIIIVIICLLLLTAYVFTISASKTKIPSVILLLSLGFSVKLINGFIGIELPELDPILPFLGSVGLILIVLEGSLELKLDKEKLPFVGKTIITAIIPLVITALIIGYGFYYFIPEATFKMGLLNAIPFCIISSAIAISSVGHLDAFNKEFAIYESSLSDIIGVLFFNFILLNEIIDSSSIQSFLGQIGLMLLISFIATAFLAFLMSRIKHHVKFIPIVLLIILIFATSEIYHLPALIFIMFFGLLMENFDALKDFKLVKILKPEYLEKEVQKFKELTIEAAFLIRSLFFLLFGYLMKGEEILNPNTILHALIIVFTIYVFRAIQLKIFKIPYKPLLFIAPRGLITILLFLNIPESQKILFVDKSLIIQVIILTALVMMFGMIINDKKTKETEEKETEEKEKTQEKTDTEPILNEEVISEPIESTTEPINPTAVE